MVSFNQVPSNIRVPFVAVEFDSSRASQGPALLPYRALLIGQKTKAGSAAANSIVRVTSADQVVALAGRGSMLHRMAIAYFSANKSTETYIGVLSDDSAAAYASGTLTVAGTATETGTISLYIGGKLFRVGVTSGDTASTIAANIASAVGKHATGTVTFSSAVASDNVTVGGTTFVGTAGAVTLGAATYSVDTGDSQAAASLAAQINAHAVAGKLVQATASSAVVTLRAISGGTGGNAIALATTSVPHAAVSGSTLSGATADSDAAVHATVSGAVVTLLARNAGAVANELNIRLGYQESEVLPGGITVDVAAMSSGATNPLLTSLIANMGDTWYHVIANPFTDATSLTALETEMASRSGPMRMIDGVVFSAKSDSYANVSALGDSRNSPYSSILRTNDSPTPPEEYAAHLAGVVAYYAPIDPARPLQTLPLPFVLAPSEVDRDTLQERNLLLYDGISTTKVASGGVVQIERLVTTYQTNAAGSPDTAYLDVSTVLTLLYLRYSFRVRFATRYPRHKLANDGTRFGSGQAIITPKLGKAEAIAWFREMEGLGLVEGFDQFKADLVVERNVSDPNRLDIRISPDLINQLIVTAAQLQFLL